MARKALLFTVLVTALVFAMSASALATDPTQAANPYTFTESTPETSAIPTTSIAGLAGASAWTYQDASDSAAKTEGSYNKFDDQSGIGTYTDNPHAGYSTASNKCKTCHAVHRATGAFALMRVDNADDACNYCHIGSHRHAASEAYFGGSNGIYSSNGHTIGANKEIPDSSVWQWTENITLTSSDGSAQVPVRRYMTQKNSMMRYIVHGDRFIRVGPNNLRCASCHQVHSASRQIWQPVWSGMGPSGGAAAAGDKMTLGYKLLRNSPSGGIAVRGTDINPDGTLNTSPAATSRAYSRLNATYFDPGDAGYLDGLANNRVDYRLKVVEKAFNPATGLDASSTPVMGPNITGYTPWTYVAPTNAPSGLVTSLRIQETSMAFWCADCHNLNIAGKTVAEGFGTGRGGNGMLGDRSHAVPSQLRQGTVAETGTHCSQCHNSDMPLDASGSATGFSGGDCGGCHVTAQMHHYYKNDVPAGGQTWAERNDTYAKGIQQAARSDWPHAGPDWGTKLLNARDRKMAVNYSSNRYETNPALHTTGGFDYDVQGSAIDFTNALGFGADGQDKVCKTCHGGLKHREIGVDK